MSNITDLVTVAKNGVVAINDLTAALNSFRDIYASSVGDKTYLGVSDSSLISTTSGRLVNVSVSAAAAGGTIHDAASVATADASNVIFPIPNQVGITQVNVPFFNGLVVKPASSSTVSLTYSES
jgi:hypothetical protein